MKRKAIIIGNPGEAGAENYCPGVLKDMDNYAAFLKDAIGGWWSSEEVISLKRPTVGELRSTLSRAANCDYALIIFAGHGEHRNSTGSTWLELRKDEEFDSNELKRVSKRLSLILDCCRMPSAPVSIEKRAMKFTEAERRINPERCREAYNNAIQAASGLVVMNACRIGEKAVDDSQKGGYYSYHLLQVSHQWANDTIPSSSNYASVVQVHNLADPLVQTKSGGRQHPEIEKPHTSPYYPFCVVA